MWDIPQWVVLMLVVLPAMIFVIVFYKLISFVDEVIRTKEWKSSVRDRIEDRDWMLTGLKFIPYAIIFYYIARFSTYILSAGAWGWTGEEFIVTPVRDSMRAMSELLLMEGIPVVLVIIFGTTTLRSAYVYITEGRG